VYDDHGGYTLDLARSNLTRLPPAVAQMTDLHGLDLSDNPELKKLPKDFHMLVKLQQLSVVHCGLAKFPVSVYNLKLLKSLRLSLNNITQFPDLLPEMQHLEALELVMCSLAEVPKCVTSLRTLKHLDLKCNKLTLESFPASMGNLQLEELDIGNNQLGSIPECIFEIISLRVLKACYCNLNEVSTSIGHLENLIDLRLTNNTLSEIPHELCSLVQLETLHLDHNGLTQLPHQVVNWEKLGIKKDSFVISANKMVEPPQDVCDRGFNAVIAYMETKRVDT
jgi:Leucine-rich repeat (LRR) protein